LFRKTCITYIQLPQEHTPFVATTTKQKPRPDDPNGQERSHLQPVSQNKNKEHEVVSRNNIINMTCNGNRSVYMQGMKGSK